MRAYLRMLLESSIPRAGRYGATVAIMGSSALVELIVHHYTGIAALFLLFPGIFFSRILFDRGSAYTATAIGTIVAAYVLVTHLDDYRGGILVALFFCTAFATAVLSEKLRSVFDRLSRVERVKDMLLPELDHRTKNNMMGMASLLRLQARAASNSEVRATLQAAASRIPALCCDVQGKDFGV